MCLAYPAEAVEAVVKEYTSEHLAAARLIAVSDGQQLLASRAELCGSRSHGGYLLNTQYP